MKLLNSLIFSKNVSHWGVKIPLKEKDDEMLRDVNRKRLFFPIEYASRRGDRMSQKRWEWRRFGEGGPSREKNVSRFKWTRGRSFIKSKFQIEADMVCWADEKQIGVWNKYRVEYGQTKLWYGGEKSEGLKILKIRIMLRKKWGLVFSAQRLSARLVIKTPRDIFREEVCIVSDWERKCPARNGLMFCTVR